MALMRLSLLAGIGENAVGVRKDIIDGMTWFGCEIDDDKNNVHGEEAVISTDDSKNQASISTN